MKRLSMLILVIASLGMFSGCPDYSHLRPVPDYENMTDGGGETSSDDAADKK